MTDIDSEKQLEQLVRMAKTYCEKDQGTLPESNSSSVGMLRRAVRSLQLSGLWLRWSIFTALLALGGFALFLYLSYSTDANDTGPELLIQPDPSFDNYPDSK